jgi:hypothetical protein
MLGFELGTGVLVIWAGVRADGVVGPGSGPKTRVLHRVAFVTWYGMSGTRSRMEWRCGYD